MYGYGLPSSGEKFLSLDVALGNYGHDFFKGIACSNDIVVINPDLIQLKNIDTDEYLILEKYLVFQVFHPFCNHKLLLLN